MDTQTIGRSWFPRAAAARGLTAAALAASLAFLPGCTSRQLDGKSPVYLIIDSLQGASGADPNTFSGTLQSDVETDGGVFEDVMLVSLRIAMKDPGSTADPTQPSDANLVTVTRYRVRFLRADGRNVPGVDVPYGFDGGMTLTVVPGGSSSIVTLVRAQAKLEAPLGALVFDPRVISTLAEVTFFGADQAGRDMSVTGLIGVNFANWADPG